MSLYSWWKWGCHGLNTSGYDHADDMVEKYTKLLNRLDSLLKDYAYYKETADYDFQNASNTLQANNAGTVGHWLSFYNEKVSQWKSHKYSYYHVMDEEYELAKSRRSTVSSYKSNWESTRDAEARSLDAARQRQIEEEERRRREREAAISRGAGW